MRVNDRNKLKKFSVGDVVKLLHACSVDPFQILMTLNDNVYVINLSINVGISSTFNVEYLVDYKGFNVIPLVDEPSTWPSAYLSSLFSATNHNSRTHHPQASLSFRHRIREPQTSIIEPVLRAPVSTSSQVPSA